MDADTLLFFSNHESALPIYEAFEQAVLERLPDTRIKVQKTQISFYNKHQFACVSFLRVRPKKALPNPYLVITFGLEHRCSSPRIAVASELMAWIEEAAAFAAVK